MQSKQKTRSVICLIAVAILARPSLAADIDAAAIEEVRVPFQQRVMQQNPVWIKYHLDRTESPTRQAIMNYTKKTQVDINWECECEYAVKGSKFRSWATVKGHPELPSGAEVFVVYNGEVRVSRNKDSTEYTISTSPKDLYVAESPFDLCGDRNWNAIFDRWVQDRKSIMKSESKLANDTGGPAIRLELTYPNGWKDRGDFYTAADYTIATANSYYDNGKIHSKREFIYATKNGFRYPSVGTFILYTPNGSINYTVNYRITSIETDAGRIPDSLFNVAIPKSATILDADRDVRLRNTDLAGSQIADAVARLNHPHSRGMFWAFVAEIATAGILGMAVWRSRSRFRPRSV